MAMNSKNKLSLIVSFSAWISLFHKKKCMEVVFDSTADCRIESCLSHRFVNFSKGILNMSCSGKF